MTKLRPIGNSTGVTIPKTILEAAGFAPDEEVVLTPGDGQITVSRADGLRAKALEAHDVCKARYGRTLAALAK